MTALLAETYRVSPDAFLAFIEDRPHHERWELIDGQAVMQASPTPVHAIIAGNVDRLMNEASEAQGSPWIAIQNAMLNLSDAGPGNLYVPDVIVVDGRTVEPLQNITLTCLAAVEVVSPSDERRVRRGGRKNIDVKLEHYRSFPLCQAILVVRRDVMDATVFLRTFDGWTNRQVSEPEAEVAVPPVGLRCRLRDLYARTPFARRS